MTESAEGTFISPGVGTITDAAGNVFSIITQNKAAYENAKPMPDGTDTARMAYHKHVVYGQDAQSQKWYSWSGKVWTLSPSPDRGAVASNLVIDTVHNQRVGVAFTVTGAFTLTAPAWNASLVVADDGGLAQHPADLKLAAEKATFSFVHPGFKAVGSEVLSLTVLGASAKSNKFQVVKG